MDAITAAGCRRIGAEVFEAEDVNTILEKAKAFFGLMPTA